MVNIDKIAVNLLQDFSASGIHILAADGQLKIESKKPLTDDQRNLIRNLKSELLDYFHDQTKIEEHLSRVDGEAEQDAFQNVRNLLFQEIEISDPELKTLRMIFSKTQENGTHLHNCADEVQAERFRQFLMRWLSEGYAALVVRETQVNTFAERHIVT
jgi:hypothetical protein